MPDFISGKQIAESKEVEHILRVQGLKQKGITPKLVIIQTTPSVVIEMYVRVKKSYGQKIGVTVEHYILDSKDVENTIRELNKDKSVHGIIVQLPLHEALEKELIIESVDLKKDIDGLRNGSKYIPPTVNAIMMLLNKYITDIKNKKIALVGNGFLVGSPLAKELTKKSISFNLFIKNDNLSPLNTYDIIISATGVSGLISNDFVKDGAYVFDAGTAEDGETIHGDVSDELYKRNGIFITPKKGGIGILTVRSLFDNLLQSCDESFH